MIDNRLLQLMLIAAGLLLVLATAITVADISRYHEGPGSRPAAAQPAG